jgi:hypothetical protein
MSGKKFRAKQSSQNNGVKESHFSHANYPWRYANSVKIFIGDWRHCHKLSNDTLVKVIDGVVEKLSQKPNLRLISHLLSGGLKG